MNIIDISYIECRISDHQKRLDSWQQALIKIDNNDFEAQLYISRSIAYEIGIIEGLNLFLRRREECIKNPMDCLEGMLKGRNKLTLQMHKLCILSLMAPLNNMIKLSRNFFKKLNAGFWKNKQ